MDRPGREVRKGLSEDRGNPKQAASPAQEATRAQIASLEAQLRRIKGSGKLDKKGNYQVRCLEEDLRKAQSKLRRLLNEAERQRRRRERLRGGGGVCAGGTYEYLSSPDDAVMTTLKTCSRFPDLVRELNSLGYTVAQNDEETEEGESMPEVEVELIEGDGELETTVKEEAPDSPVIALPDAEYENFTTTGENFRRWFERHTEAQHVWEERLMREQMEMARSILESVTTTFVQGIQQVLTTLMENRRFPGPNSTNDTEPS